MVQVRSSVSRRQTLLAVAALSSVAALCGCGGDDDSSAALVPPVPGAASCAAIMTTGASSSAFPANTKVTSSTLVPAANGVPEHCNVVGTVNAGRQGAQSSPGVNQTYAINWQVRLPTSWNGNFAMEGGGGLDGTVPGTTGRLAAGYATAASDSGHSITANNDPLAGGGAATFGTDYQARVDFAYNAIDQTSLVAQQLIATYYGSASKHSYFEGCSMGGREGMMVTQKLPTRFDGVVVGDPGFKLTAMSTMEVYDAQILASLATSMGLISVTGVPLLTNTYKDSDLQLVSKAILDACDAKDGLVDGMVNAPMQCTTAAVTPFLDALTCSGAKTDTCLTAAQIDVVKKMYAGPVTPKGQTPYYGWMWDPGIAGCTSAADCNVPGATNIATGAPGQSWRTWRPGIYQSNLSTASNNGFDYVSLAGGGLTTMVAPTPFSHPASPATDDLLRIILGYDLDNYYASIFATTTAFPTSSHALLDVDSTDLSAFNNHGGKVLIWQPQSGGPFSPLAMVEWYKQVNTASGGTPFDFTNVQKFARLFMMPGAQHCGGGPSTSIIDPFSAVVDWVEHGNAPAKLVGTAPATTPWPGRKRPLCPFPQTAVYSGTGSIEEDANFSCQ